jgi:hypothetical protein
MLSATLCDNYCMICCITNRGLEGVLRHDPDRLSVCAAAAKADKVAVEALIKQGVSPNSRHR